MTLVAADRPDTLAPVDRILLGDNLPLLRAEPDASVTLAYLDPPFNTGRAQSRRTLAARTDANGDRNGFGGRRYATRLLNHSSYRDDFDDYLGFLEPRLHEVRRLLSREGTLYSTSTTARRTTASCCSTRSSGATASSTS